MLTLLAFVLALGILITVHEYGHYKVAVLCGVKVLKFSIGFGRPLYTWRFKHCPTEFAIGMLPLGGYVKMLDETDGPVEAAERHLAFNQKSLKVRAAVVAAGPLANLLLAVLLYTLVNWMGVQAPQAILSSPVPWSVAQRAGLQAGQKVLQVAVQDRSPVAIRSFEELQWQLMQAALGEHSARLWVQGANTSEPVQVVLDLAPIKAKEVNAQLLHQIGIEAPLRLARITQIMPGRAAEKAGLQAGDMVLRVGNQEIFDAAQLRRLIKESVSSETVVSRQTWHIVREGQAIELQVQPEVEEGVARIGAYIGAPIAMTLVRYGFWDGLSKAAVRTWEVSKLNLSMLGNMLTGQASLKGLSGPLTIAEYAGQSASLGLTSYLLFLALISVSLGVLNLLPIPLLDGGHLLYYSALAVTGRSLPQVWMERLQRAGLALLLTLMAVALFNDIHRLVG